MSAGISFNFTEGSSSTDSKTQKRSLSPTASTSIAGITETPREATSGDCQNIFFKKKKNQTIENHETDETRKLSNTDLQRLVLLEQLETARAQKAAAREQEAFYRAQMAYKQNISAENPVSDLPLFANYLNL